MYIIGICWCKKITCMVGEDTVMCLTPNIHNSWAVVCMFTTVDLWNSLQLFATKWCARCSVPTVSRPTRMAVRSVSATNVRRSCATSSARTVSRQTRMVAMPASVTPAHRSCARCTAHGASNSTATVARSVSATLGQVRKVWKNYSGRGAAKCFCMYVTHDGDMTRDRSVRLEKCNEMCRGVRKNINSAVQWGPWVESSCSCSVLFLMQ